MRARVDRCSGGGDRFEEEVATFVFDVVAVQKNMALANKCFGEMGARVMGEAVGGGVVGEYVRGGRDEDWWSFEEGDILGWKFG